MNELALVALIAAVFFTLASHADEDFKEKGSFHHRGCYKSLKLSSEQKTKMKDAFFNFRSNKIDLKANLEKAKLAYEKIAMDPKADPQAAKAASEQVSENLSKLMSAKIAFKNQVAFEILKPEQRPEAVKCELRRKRHRMVSFDHEKRLYSRR